MKTSNDNQKEYTMFSGGAYGADTLWTVVGEMYRNINFKHIRTADNSRISARLKYRKIKPILLTPEQLEEAYVKLSFIEGIKCHKSLQNSLKARNFWQVEWSESILAIAYLDDDRKSVLGGTKYAIEFAKAYDSKPIYVYDIKSLKWYQYMREFNGFIEHNETPKLTKTFAGIGTRDVENYRILKDGTWMERPQYLGIKIEHAVIDAIHSVYRNTFGENKNQ